MDKDNGADLDLTTPAPPPPPPNKDLVDENGNNHKRLQCLHCPSKIMEANTAKFHKEEKNLPKMSQKKNNPEVESDQIEEWFVVDDIYQFENVGVSNLVEGLKYLTCADCEMGPIGWTDLSTKKCYVASSRVKHT